MLAGQIVVQVPYSTAPVCRTRGVREHPGEDDERLLRRSEPRRQVVRIEVRGLDAVVLTPVPSGFFSLPLCHATFLLARPLYSSQDTSMSACQHVSTPPAGGVLTCKEVQALCTSSRSRRMSSISLVAVE